MTEKRNEAASVERRDAVVVVEWLIGPFAVREVTPSVGIERDALAKLLLGVRQS